MVVIKNINSKANRQEDKEICKLWLSPSCLTAKQIRDTIDDFSCIISFTLNPETDEDRVASNIAILVDDLMEMDSISMEEKDKETLEYVNIYKKQLRSLARRVIKQINIDVRNYKNEAKNRGYCNELIKRA